MKQYHNLLKNYFLNIQNLMNIIFSIYKIHNNQNNYNYNKKILLYYLNNYYKVILMKIKIKIYTIYNQI